MTAAKEILRIAPLVQSAALLHENTRFAKKKKKTSGDFVGMGVKNLVGIEMLKTQSSFIEGFD